MLVKGSLLTIDINLSLSFLFYHVKGFIDSIRMKHFPRLVAIEWDGHKDSFFADSFFEDFFFLELHWSIVTCKWFTYEGIDGDE